MEKIYCVYKHTNKINNKVYIGQTCQKPEYRWGKNGNNYIQCPYFWKAIQKYGWENFQHEILETDIPQNKINEREQFYILQYESYKEDRGYNCSKGGQNCPNTISEATREKYRENMKKRWEQPGYKEYFSQLMKDKYADEQYYNSHVRAQLSEEHRKAIKEATINTSHWNEKAVICLETNEIYKSSGEAGRILQINSNNIRSVCTGERRTAGGYHWLFVEDDNEENRKKRLAKPEGNGIKVICIQTGQIFNSAKDASKWCGLKSATSISSVCNGTRKTAGKHPITKEPLTWKKYIEQEN